MEDSNKKQHYSFLSKIDQRSDEGSDKTENTVERWYADGFVYSLEDKMQKNRETINFDRYVEKYGIDSLFENIVYDRILMKLPSEWLVNAEFDQNDDCEWCVKFEVKKEIYIEAFPNENLSKLLQLGFLDRLLY